MFFSISKKAKQNYSDQHTLGQFTVSTDPGWQRALVGETVVLFKGYADYDSLTNILSEIVSSSVPTHTGNFCVLCLSDNVVTIKTDKYRSFPIYVSEGIEVTNLNRYEHICWTDSVLSVDENINVHYNRINVIGDIDTTPITHSDGINIIDKILTDKTKAFVAHNTLPIRAFMSGGVDSALTYSYMARYATDYTSVTYNHVEWDEFWMKNSGTLQQNWAYKQMHYWADDCILTTGSPGDEFMLRSPRTVSMFLFSKGTSVPEINTDHSNLHYSYFTQEKHLKVFAEQEELNRQKFSKLSEKVRNRLICDDVLNDWQHWHLGRTLTWTPLRDIEITKTLLRMPYESILGQILDSSISKELMNKQCPGISSAISDQKNTGNALKNLFQYYLSNRPSTSQ